MANINHNVHGIDRGCCQGVMPCSLSQHLTIVMFGRSVIFLDILFNLRSQHQNLMV